MITLFKPSAIKLSQVLACSIFSQLLILAIILFSWNVFRNGLDSVIQFLRGLHLISVPVPFQSRLVAASPVLSQFQMVSPRDLYQDRCFSCCILLPWAIVFNKDKISSHLWATATSKLTSHSLLLTCDISLTSVHFAMNIGFIIDSNLSYNNHNFYPQ